MHKKNNGLPVWAFRAANALRNGYPISEVLEYYEVEFAPNNIRTVLSARDDDRIAKHHDHAVHIALLSSEGSDVDYAQSLVRWTAIETAEAAGETIRGCNSFDHRTRAEKNREKIIAQLVEVGAFTAAGIPAHGTGERRAGAVTTAHLAAYYDHRDDTDKEKRNQKGDADSGGPLSWLDDESPYGKTISIDEPTVVSRLVVIHAAPKKMATSTRSGGADEDTRIKLRGTLSRKMQIGPDLDRHRIDEIYAELVGEAGWHARIIEWLWRRHLEVLDDPERCCWLPPSLIIGPPGCGKTFLLTRLAEMLDLPAVRVDMSGSLEPWPIAGGAWGWRNAQPGVAVKTIIESGFANPFILLDEIEKAGKSHLGGPLIALLPLLQRETAKKYRCPYLEAEIDLSRVSWVMLGNSLAPIGGPLRDRVTIMHARGPEGPEIRQLVERKLGELVADQQVIDAAIAAMESGKMSLRGLHRIAREFQAIDARPQLN